MISAIICLLAFISVFVAGRRSLSAGTGLALTFGYMYGIIRANSPQPASHFIFDAASAGLYLAIFTRPKTPLERRRIRKVAPWALALFAWPATLALLPIQDPLIQLVGLRGQAFFLPFLILGAMFDDIELRKLAFWIAVLDIVAFAFAGGEYFLGVPRFYPRNAATEIIYVSKDVANYTAFRIPGTFVNPAGYGGMMVLGMPLLVGAWAQRRGHTWARVFLAAALAMAVMGVFLCASRTQAAAMIVLAIVVTLSFRVRVTAYLGWSLMIAGIVWIVASSPRLQRFTTLQDTSFVESRIRGSVNSSFLEKAADHPLGSGLGGGGTSIPYFLQGRIENQELIENEYARIVVEEGIPGLMLWALFIFWVVTRAAPRRSDPWFLGRRLAYVASLVFLATGLTGLGLFTWIPGTALLLFMIGWVAAPNKARVPMADPFAPAVLRGGLVMTRMGT
ncbi:MAG: O-antigen ligase family protein [Candidatus Binatus sp.]|uniref:O-antigen ligase family protein n=1 Tax=Candidatus Binatus sp. TaxID=2811406 RepID=UPI0027255EDF|nr:O-antigen ligase family protein [Candidatus Binatus sp.]MDO8431598.1 O-antigen ligase family protein [Candidatus Binatus sp.]